MGKERQVRNDDNDEALKWIPLAGTQKEIDTYIRKMLENARADERRKQEAMKAKLTARAYENGVAKGQASRDDEIKNTQIEAYELGIKEGQADLIEKGWQILQSYNNTALWHSKHFLLMLIKTSESAEVSEGRKVRNSTLPIAGIEQMKREAYAKGKADKEREMSE